MNEPSRVAVVRAAEKTTKQHTHNNCVYSRFARNVHMVQANILGRGGTHKCCAESLRIARKHNTTGIIKHCLCERLSQFAVCMFCGVSVLQAMSVRWARAYALMYTYFGVICFMSI